MVQLNPGGPSASVAGGADRGPRASRAGGETVSNISVNEDGATVADFDVAGLPVPQGSMRAFVRRNGGRPIVTSDNPRTKPWKAAVTAAAAEARRWICAGPLVVEIDFRLPRPKGHYGRRGTVLPSAPSYPTTKPDVDKLVRAILDALTEARVWHDDAQVVALSAIKGWSEEPGAHVRVVAL